MKRKIKQMMCSVLMLAMVFSLLVGFPSEVVQAATVTNRVPIICYTIPTGRVTTYNHVGGSSTGYIDGAIDQVRILEIYSNGWCKVKYPISRGYKTAYAKSSSFFGNVNFSTSMITLGQNKSVFRRANLSQSLGTVYANDRVIIVGTSGNTTQIIYPISGGYKMGWVSGKYSANKNTGQSSGLCSPVPDGVKFNRKTQDGKWYGYHDININVSTSTPVRALADGSVTFKQAYTTINGVKMLTSYGNFCEFKSRDGVYTAKYCHLDRFNGVNQIIKSSQTRQRSGASGVYTLAQSKSVKAGDVIGYIGTTGNSSGLHLHFELFKNGSRIDPTSIFPNLK